MPSLIKWNITPKLHGIRKNHVSINPYGAELFSGTSRYRVPSDIQRFNHDFDKIEQTGNNIFLKYNRANSKQQI